MLITRNLDFDARGRNGSYEEPSLCPLCKHAIKPHELSIATFKDEDGHWFMTASYLCKHCYQTFIVLHSCELFEKPSGFGSTLHYKSSLLYAEPTRYERECFDPKIETLSPQFAKIYNQALAAEAFRLDEIAGLGYRKAMEFLVKDYCIHKNPADAETIKNLPLSRCITTYVQNVEIQTLATRSAWIGNDEAHYIRKQENRDVSDMKAFIRAMVYFVGMSLIVEDAASMAPA